MAEDKNYTNNKERPREDEELEIDLMEYVRKLWAARKMLLKVALAVKDKYVQHY